MTAPFDGKPKQTGSTDAQEENAAFFVENVRYILLEIFLDRIVKFFQLEERESQQRDVISKAEAKAKQEKSRFAYIIDELMYKLKLKDCFEIIQHALKQLLKSFYQFFQGQQAFSVCREHFKQFAQQLGIKEEKIEKFIKAVENETDQAVTTFVDNVSSMTAAPETISTAVTDVKEKEDKKITSTLPKKIEISSAEISKNATTTFLNPVEKTTDTLPPNNIITSRLAELMSGISQRIVANKQFQDSLAECKHDIAHNEQVEIFSNACNLLVQASVFNKFSEMLKTLPNSNVTSLKISSDGSISRISCTYEKTHSLGSLIQGSNSCFWTKPAEAEQLVNSLLKNHHALSRVKNFFK